MPAVYTSTSLVTPSLIGLAVFLYYGGLWLYPGWRMRAKGLRLPPGPKGKLFYGNLHQVPLVEPWLTFTSWAKVYGPIFYYHAFGKETIVLNSGKVALDLLESRSGIYSDRTSSRMGELAGRNHTVFATSFADPRFKVFRRLLQTGLSAKASKSYRPIQTQEAHVLLKGLLNSPEDFRAHIRRNAVAVILKVAYGCQVTGNDDPLVTNLEDGFRASSVLYIPGKYLVEFMPILRFVPEWFPGAGFRRIARQIGGDMCQIEQAPFDWAKKEISSGDYVESFTSKHLLLDDGQLVAPKTQDNIMRTSSALYVGGGETTVSGLSSFFLLMALHPDVQRRAQADVDRVAINRLPTLDDYNSLPYIKAIIKEILRWSPVAPLGLAHRVMEDDVYEDYFIPKGCKILSNIWAITHDEEIYPDPLTFDPNRHLGENPQPDPFKFVFGFGRRICPGLHLAEMSLFLNISNILSVFNISKAIDDKGMEIEPTVEWTTGVTTSLKPFKCQIKARSLEHVLYLDRQE